MPIETRTVLICGHCGGTKAQANGWWLLTFWPRRIEIQPVPDGFTLPEDAEDNKTLECACGQECVVSLVSRTLHALGDHKTPAKGNWKRQRR